jgi:23S rRNA (pseudouridine1915-N3)-methyltransferase
MKITVLSVGRVRQRFIIDGEAEYRQRLGKEIKLELSELGIESPTSMSKSEVKEREADQLLKRLPQFDYVIVLDEVGKEYTSIEIERLLSSRMQMGTRHLAFVIGGSFGFSERVRQAADTILSLSKLTFPHQLVRLLLVEQIYRAHTMMRGIKYHK